MYQNLRDVPWYFTTMRILTTHSTLRVDRLDSSAQTSLPYVVTGPVYVLILLKPITPKVVSSFLFFGFDLLKTLFRSLIALPDSFEFKHWTSPHFTVFRWRQKVIVFYAFWLGSCNFLDGFRSLKGLGLKVFTVWWFLTNDRACIPSPLKERLNFLSRIL